MAKAAEAFRTISEVADDLGIQKHVLRFWEVKFSQIRPMKRGGGRRYYRPEDMELLRGIRQLLHRDGYTIKGVQKILREQGVEAVKLRVAAEEELVMGGRSVGPHSTETESSGQASVPAKSTRGRKGQAAPVPASVPPSREQVLRGIVAELIACREILAGREPIAKAASRPASRSRHSA